MNELNDFYKLIYLIYQIQQNKKGKKELQFKLKS